MKTLNRTFQETVYLEIQGAKNWELTILVYGCRTEDSGDWITPGIDEIDVYGIECIAAQYQDFDGEWVEVSAPADIELLDKLINAKYWRGQLGNEIEDKVRVELEG